LLLIVSWPVAAAELTVSAASSLTEGFRDIARAYEQAHPDTTVALNFAASGVLLQQVARGAPVDVLATADTATMDAAASRGLLADGSRVVFARNALWVVVPVAARRRPARLQDLGGAGIERVAIGNPDSVPAGRYARKALLHGGQWARLQRHLIQTQNVRQSLDYVARGEVDAGFVYATDAQAAAGRVQPAFEVPVGEAIDYPIATIEGSRQADQAARFIAFVRSAQGQAILHRHGFRAP